jgi:hypothetical protein
MNSLSSRYALEGGGILQRMLLIMLVMGLIMTGQVA